MKNLFTLTAALLFAFNLLAQPYESMLRDDVLWEVRYIQVSGNVLDNLQHVHYWLDDTKDTTINGFDYSGFNLNGYYDGDPIYLREQTDSGFVFALDDSLNEFMLCDFSLSIGDTFLSIANSSLWGQDSLWKEVTVVDSVLVDSTWRKRLQLESIGASSCTEYWTEGVGSSFGPQGVGGDCWHSSVSLFCYREKDAGLTSLYSPSGICTPVGIEEKPTIGDVKIWPNPARESIQIQSPDGVKGVILISSTGSTWTLPVQNNLNISHLPSGLYLMQIETEKGMVQKKLMVEH